MNEQKTRIKAQDATILVKADKSTKQLRIQYKNWTDTLPVNQGDVFELTFEDDLVIARHRTRAAAAVTPPTSAMLDAGTEVIVDIGGDDSGISSRGIAERVYEAMEAVRVKARPAGQ